MPIGKQLAIRLPREPLNEVDALLREQGFDEWSINSKGGKKIIVGRSKNGITARLSLYTGVGFRSRSSSVSEGLTPAERKVQAKRMSKEGLKQWEIAEHLGCSQKTVSNDLRK